MSVKWNRKTFRIVDIYALRVKRHCIKLMPGRYPTINFDLQSAKFQIYEIQNVKLTHNYLYYNSYYLLVTLTKNVFQILFRSFFLPFLVLKCLLFKMTSWSVSLFRKMTGKRRKCNRRTQIYLRGLSTYTRVKK